MYKLILILLVFLTIGTRSFAQNEKDPAETATTTTITIKVKGATCSNDLKTLANNVKDLKGVSDCKTGKAGPVSEFQISYNPALVGTKEIYKAIEETGGCSDPKDKPYKVKTN